MKSMLFYSMTSKKEEYKYRLFFFILLGMISGLQDVLINFRANWNTADEKTRLFRIWHV